MGPGGAIWPGATLGSMAPRAVHVTPPRGLRFPRLAEGFEYLRRGFVVSGDGLLRTWGDPDAPYVIRVDPAGPRWRVTVRDVEPAAARAAVRTMFAFDDPLDEFYAAVRREPVLRGTDRRFAGLRTPRDGSLYESLVHAVIGQQLSVAVATTLERRLIDLAGTRVSVDGIEVPHLPGPRSVLALDPDRFGAIGLSRAKQAAIRGIALRATEGAFDPPGPFRDAPVEVAVARLDALPGVGRWTAENALLRGAGRRDVFLAGDLGVRSALAAYGAIPRDATEREARAWADRWYPGWGSYATLYLWRKWVAEGAPRAPTRRDPAAGPVRRPRARRARAPAGSRTSRPRRRPGRRS